MIVYHYTTEKSFKQIIRTKQFKPSNPWTTMDSAYGTGWYFTDLSPDICDMTIAYYCWRNTSDDVLKRTEYYLKFNIDSGILKNPREHVYMVPVQPWNERLIKYLGGGKNKDCSLKPCKTCDKVKGIGNGFSPNTA